jgi:hypothetical protein
LIRYGRPPKGSRTEQRGLAAQAHIQQEVKYLCEIIKSMGRKSDDLSTTTYEITFKELFDVCIKRCSSYLHDNFLLSFIQIFQINSLVFFFEHVNMVLFIFLMNMKYYFKANMIMLKLFFFKSHQTINQLTLQFILRIFTIRFIIVLN